MSEMSPEERPLQEKLMMRKLPATSVMWRRWHDWQGEGTDRYF
jgi:hypothetical protein